MNYIFVLIIYLIWFIVAVYLTIAALGAKPEPNRRLGQSFGLLFGIIAAFLIPRLHVFNFLRYPAPGNVVTGIGAALCALGMALLVWGRQSLGRNWSQTVSVKQKPELVTSGPYHWVHHPIYAGGLVASLGSAVACRGGWIFLFLILGSIFILRIFAEDRLMASQFPSDYPAYKKRTWALIPFIW